ncbi:CmpA/NrtA family ABC transporter substrate-binding protein [Sulfurovum sp. zt1-1]|uniref:CmpA/NrtA family ABC transporter substrate-binding protein n=1 Tax=Sulfurovum zhangzhouensis TaxID=3019067 RepID=A0ABT7QUU7_9BACT|nr:CmpA/NrtA family ABC transporter substrate-binding protein [Sulfurovum zhangzhouensis]MDM5270610.1 CmpA/NrtA family ABC transporter substrate-binding protein [Sulfurovum zhangzhouensis]
MLRKVLKIGLGLSLVTSTLLAEIEKKDLKIGFIALTDCAPIVIAKEKGFFSKYGLNVDVEKEGGGWPGIQQKVINGEYDFSHALAGMPIAATLGINGNAHLQAVLSLDYNGNGITYGNKIIKEMKKYGMDDKKRPLGSEALKMYIDAKHKAEGDKYQPLNFGMVHPVSTHNYELRYWMATSGIKPDEDTTIKPFPPPTMPSNLIAGNIEGYCVGEPWNERIVMTNKGSTLVTNYDIWNNNPEKVLQTRADFVDKYPETTKAVIKAIIEAQMWLDASWENRKEAAKILSKPNYVKAPVNVLEKSMIGTFQYLKGQESEPNPMFNVFANYYASYPFYSHGMWFITQMYRWGQIDKAVNMKEVIEKVYRPDLFAEAAKEVGYSLPPSPWKIDGIDEYNKFMDGKVYDPNKAIDYIYSFEVTNPKVSKEDLLKENNWTVETKQPEYVCPYGPAGCADPKFVTK